MSDEPYMAFATECDYRDHIGEIIGKRIRREQRKLEDARERITELQERVEELEAETRRGCLPTCAGSLSSGSMAHVGEGRIVAVVE